MKYPAGTYYIGDPCYVIANDLWHSAVDQMFDGQKPITSENGGCLVKLPGCSLPFWVAGTAWGDGGYFDQQRDFEYSVDSGSIGVVPKRLVAKFTEGDGRMVRFDEPFIPERRGGGVFHIGPYKIDTDPEEGDD